MIEYCVSTIVYKIKNLNKIFKNKEDKNKYS